MVPVQPGAAVDPRGGGLLTANGGGRRPLSTISLGCPEPAATSEDMSVISIPGWLIALLTFPGVILHEWAHKVFCDLFDIPVYEVRYFTLRREVAGFVKHGEPSSFSQSFWISCGPLVINSSVTVLLGAATAQAINGSALQIFLGWLGVSMGMHAFPSDHDARRIVDASRAARKMGGSRLYILAFPFVALIFAANALRFFWVDAAYAGMLFIAGMAIGNGAL